MDVANGQKPLSGQPSATGGSGMDKGKEWQMELLIEKLRSKASTFKSLVETAKNLRMAMLDKRFAIDSAEKSQLQKCLDTLQHSIKVTSLQSMVERLESLTRQLGLKFMMSGPPGTELFISSDMFFLEVLLEPTGVVKDVKIHHEGKNEQQSCDVLVSCLSRGDFLDFTVQLEGLASIYQLNADKKVKCKAFSALQSLEADLGILAQLQTFIKEPFNLVHKSPVGILERRRGGHAMKLTYFVSPYDLIDLENLTYDALSSDIVIKRKIGHSVTVCIEGSTAHKLPTSSIITVNRSPTGKSTPSYAPLTGTNSSVLPACFVLKLAKKMPMCMELVRRIQKVTELECGDISAPHPLLSLIVQHASKGQLDCRNNRRLYVTLPDQQHCYFMTENKNMEGVLVCSIPFTHPAHVPQILVYLRQQALFNTLIATCVRPIALQDPEHATIFEVSALSWQHISVSLEHPFEETMATAELDLTDISALKCKLYGISITNTEQTSDLTGKVLQKCLSIPLTMRILMKSWESRDSLSTMNNLNSGNGNYNVNIGSGKDQNSQNNSGMPDFTNGETKIKQEPEKKSPIIFEENKSLVPPSVSITPISSSSLGQTTNYNSVLTGMGLERRPGIEIIPIASSPQTTLPSSITITPIAGPTQSKSLTDERRERKSSKGKSTEDKGKLEKRRKRKREDSPMGPPPDKIPSKQDPLSKPVSVSIKPTESPPNLSSRPSSPATTSRKFSPSPTHTSPLALVGKSSPTLKQSTNKPVQSPKHSPVYSSSPKHTPVPASVSPKHGTSSPKHGSSASTGKPSMSALKSAANSPSSKTADSGQSKIKSSSSLSSKDSNREKERKTSSLAFGGSSGHQSPKTKSSSGKLKQLELIPSGETQSTLPSSGGSTPPSGNSELGKSAIAQQQARNRKGSLSAVIDKLKNAQHCTDDGGNGGTKSTTGGSGNSSGQKERSVGSSSNKTAEGKCISKNSSMDTKNPAEYMVKHSSDGMKITINKTRTKDSKSGTNLKLSSSSASVATGTSSSSSTSSATMSGNGSPKTHTGLKPGVSSGPASKKPPSQTSPKLSGSSSSGSGSSSGNKTTLLGQKMLSALKSISGSNSGSGNGAGGISVGSSSSSGLLSKNVMSSKSSSSSPKTASSGVTDLSRNRDKSRLSKSGDKSIFPSKGIGDTRKSSPSGLREESESERAFKILASHASMNLSNLPPQLVVEGLIKQLDTKFQIPKLSARANADSGDKKSEKMSMLPDSGKTLDNLTTKQTSEQGKLQTLSNTSSTTSKATSEDQSSQSRRDHVQTKPDNLSMTSSASVINLGTDSASNLLLPALSSSSSHDMDILTNLSVQSAENESRDKELSMSRSNTQFLSSSLNSTAVGKDDSTASGPVMAVLPKGSDAQPTSKSVYPTMMTTGTITSGNGTATTSSGNGSAESLNLSIKPPQQQSQQQQPQPPQVSSSGGSSSSSSLGTTVSSEGSSSTMKTAGTEIPTTTSQEAAEMLLDFSTPKDVAKSLNFTSIPERAMTQAASVRRNTPPPPPPAFPASPSVSVHIVKSPAPSPRVIPPSPHSASPCITDDELMDEALVGMGK
ncbi:Mediator of RNA polymerase II transcription subunit 1 [Eufriesea mexicana]|uniref:Mediator of RNA polymerase II transcription subunit 1 n=1 Tax=Eufriesea mexicana TaxID=516756 RepID=A0A310S8K6_9HYME|nr:Mediator of RNA polymerase II transcription subunit 1 [Eufriesea mexicana]